MLGMDIKAQVLFLSVNQWTIERDNKSGFTAWMCMSESNTSNKRGYEPVKQSLDISFASTLSPVLAQGIKFPVVCDCTFSLSTGGQSAKPVLKSIDKIIKSIEL